MRIILGQHNSGMDCSQEMQKTKKNPGRDKQLGFAFILIFMIGFMTIPVRTSMCKYNRNSVRLWNGETKKHTGHAYIAQLTALR